MILLGVLRYVTVKYWCTQDENVHVLMLYVNDFSARIAPSIRRDGNEFHTKYDGCMSCASAAEVFPFTPNLSPLFNKC